MPDLLADDYASAGFGGHLPFGKKPAVIFIDVVMAYVAPESPLCLGADNALGPMRRLRDAAHETGAPVIFTNIAYDPDGVQGGMFFRKVPALRAFCKGSPMGEFVPDFTPEATDRVVGKFYPSAFFGTALAPMLHGLGVDTVLLAGYSTSGCVRATALDALCSGFAPYVVRDCCADRDPAPHESNLFDMQQKMAEVIDCDMAVQHLFNSASGSEA